MAQEDIASRLHSIRARVAEAEAAANRGAGAVTLVAISKTHPADAVEAAYREGQRVFGENRVQEAQAKFAALKALHPDIVLHLVGPLQSNKVKEAVALFDVIESIDRPRLAEAVAEEMGRTGRRPLCFIQVNTGEEPQKAGILPKEAAAFIEDCRSRLKLPVEGLMCIPPVGEEPSPHFAFLRELARRHGLKQLSMGMSGDFDIAIRFGATYVRVGTAIFGERPQIDTEAKEIKAE